MSGKDEQEQGEDEVVIIASCTNTSPQKNPRTNRFRNECLKFERRSEISQHKGQR